MLQYVNFMASNFYISFQVKNPLTIFLYYIPYCISFHYLKILMLSLEIEIEYEKVHGKKKEQSTFSRGLIHSPRIGA